MNEFKPLVTSLTTSATTYQLGDPILITFTIENISNETYRLLKWGTPLEQEVNGDFLTLRRDNETIGYDGKLIKRGDPSPESYVTIMPGERLMETLDISTAYPIHEPGDYIATFKCLLNDVFIVAGNNKEATRSRKNHEPHRFDSQSVHFKVVAGGKPKLTSGELARQATQLVKNGPNVKGPNFMGWTGAEQDDTPQYVIDTQIAHNYAQHFAALSASQLQGTTGSTNALYAEWFGAFDKARYDTVLKHYTDISNMLNSEVTYEFDFTSGSKCKGDMFAYTYYGLRTIWLCDKYLNAPQFGKDCKFGVLIHEWSHAFSDTNDNAYGQTACRDLATTDTNKAINNADSHEYFTEELVQSNFGKSLTLITDRSSFGRDEVDAMLNAGSPAVITNAFYVVADGFWPDKLGITPSSLFGAPNVKPTISMTPSVPGMTVSITSLEAEDTELPEALQRFTWVCQLVFANNNGFPATAGELQVTLTASLAGLSSDAQIRLIREPHPYELDGPTSWLSTDLRVFQMRAGDSRFGATMGTSAKDASAFIKQVVSNLNSGISDGQTFDSISVDQQTSMLELAQQVNGINVFNFAIAKVRYVGTMDISNVRVFFRLFPAATTSTDYNPNTTYRRATNGTSAIPILGLNGNGDVVTIPCFAEPRVDSAKDSIATQADPTNVQTIIHGGGNEVAAFFGCWLDINQPQPQFPSNPGPSDGPWTTGRKSIQELMRNAHQCLIAEIVFDPDPIPTGASPGWSDKIAQRNLSIVESANPGKVASRRILNVFDLQPPVATTLPQGMPDELLIDWGNTPRDSVATIYIPEIHAEQIVALANERYTRHTISQIDNQTLQLKVGGISYVPLPPGVAFGLTGLLSVDLPGTVHKGEVYTIVVRQVTDATAKPTPSPPPIHKRETSATIKTTSKIDPIRWRQIVGSYQITIPVRTKEVMLPREMRLLSVLRWILASLSPTERWYPVFSRYVGQIGERVGALGGDPSRVEGSPTGGAVIEPCGEPTGEVTMPCGEPTNGGGEPRYTYDGKVTGLIYDCFGDFEGFLLNNCCTELRFQSREHQIEELVRTAWRERIAITVVTGFANSHLPLSIILRRAPEPFQS